MRGETDVSILLKNLQPVLHNSPYVFRSVDRDTYDRSAFEPLASFVEVEGVSLIVSEEQACDAGLPYDSIWACITLSVHSALSAVGLLAAITSKLAEAGISVNPVSAYYHDHLFVPWERRDDAMQALSELRDAS
jgi:hypothetical protein